MSESLFRRLCEVHPASLQRLSYQYRMNGDVMALCNDLTYSGRLRCGNARVEGQRLVLPDLGAIPPPQLLPLPAASGSRVASAGGMGRAGRDGPAWQGRTPPSSGALAPTAAGKLAPWLTEVLDPDRRVAFLDTDALSLDDQGNVEPGAGAGRDGSGRPRAVAAGAGTSRRPFLGLEVRSAALAEDKGGQRGRGMLVNAVECDIVRLLAWGLDAAGFDLGAVGIISPYRSQVGHVLCLCVFFVVCADWRRYRKRVRLAKLCIRVAYGWHGMGGLKHLYFVFVFLCGLQTPTVALGRPVSLSWLLRFRPSSWAKMVHQRAVASEA